MSPVLIATILVAALVTATISGVFGMAGGLILMGVLTTYLPVASAPVNWNPSRRASARMVSFRTSR